MTKGRDMRDDMKPLVWTYYFGAVVGVGFLIGLGLNVLLGVDGGNLAVAVAVAPSILLLIPATIWWMRD